MFPGKKLAPSAFAWALWRGGRAGGGREGVGSQKGQHRLTSQRGDQIAAAASFHGGRLATDLPTSPHLLATKIKAEVYVAGADKDDSYPPQMAERLEIALTQAGVRHKCEIYAGKIHGWMKPDMPVFDADAAERGWHELFALYSRTLK